MGEYGWCKENLVKCGENMKRMGKCVGMWGG